jgi:CRISPR-associated protein Cmr1
MSRAPKLTVALETVTPMFLGGADPRGMPELRAPSFRGVMRYWWRALAGAYLDNNFEVLKQTETEIFGSTNKASPVIVQVKGKPRYFDLEQRADRTSGYNYLYWSLFLQHKGKKPSGIAPGSTFEVSLGLRPGLQDQALWQAGAALWLTVRLGGLGSRSRRTLGSLTARKESDLGSDSPLPQFVSMASDLTALAAELETGLQSLRILVGNNGTKPAHEFNVLHKDRCAIWVVGGKLSWSRWENAAETIGNALRIFRQSFPLHKRVALGLPLKSLKEPPHQRYASPLILTLAPLSDGHFAGIVVMFHPLVDSSASFKDTLVGPFVEQFDVRKEVSL